MSDQFKIDKVIPMTPHERFKYPFGEMEVGDSIYSDTNVAVFAAYQYGRRNGKQFSTSKEGTGIRVWRVS